MSPPVTRRRRSAKGFFLLLLLLAAVGIGIWWKFFRTPAEEPIAGPERLGFPDAHFRLHEEQRPIMGTFFKVAVYAPDETLARQAMAEAFERAVEIDAICSDYKPDSELSRLNTRDHPGPHPVSPTLVTVLAHAREAADATDGRYDPTLGTLTQIWRQVRDTEKLPDPATLTAAREATGWRHLKINLDESTVTIDQPGLLLDLGGIAKGFAADEMIAVLAKHGLKRAYIAAGGDIRVGDPPPGAPAWRVGLRTFGPDVEESIALVNAAVSTSGDLYQFVVIAGRRYAHIIDPATGLGLPDRIAASVIAPTATQSDPLATFCCVSPEIALQVFIGGDIACRIVTLGDPEPRDLRSPHFPRVDLR